MSVRNISPSLSVAVTAFWLVAACLAAETLYAKQPAPDRPVIRLSETDRTFRDLLQGEVFEHEITIYNEGTAPLEIHKAIPSCDCIVVKSLDQVIPPSGSGKLVLVIDTKRIKAGGDQRKRVKIRSNDPVTPEVAFWFTAEVTSLVRTNPRKIELTGIVDQVKETTIELLANTALGFEVLEVRSRGGKFDVVEKKLIEKDKRYQVRLRAKPASQVGALRDPLDMTIRVRDGRTVTVGVWVNINHTDHILVDQPTIRFSNRDTNKLLVDNPTPVIKRITVAAADPKTQFKVTGVRIEGIPDGIFKTEVSTLMEGRRYEVRVILSEYQKKTYVRGKLIILTDDSRRPEISIDAQAIFGRKRRG